MRDLTEREQRLVAAVGAGERLDLGADDGPAEIRAEAVRDLLIGRLGGEPDPRGMRLRGATILGILDLDGIRTPMRLQLRDCAFPGGIRMRGAALSLVDLGGSRIGGLLADDMTLAGSALLWRRLRVDGLVSFVGARIGGKLDLTGARLVSQTGPALAADRLTLAGDLLLTTTELRGRGEAGAMSLSGCRIGGRLSARGLQATNPTGPAAVADNLQVTDTVDFSRGVVARGQGERGTVRLVGARLGSLSFGGARLENGFGRALAAHYLDVDGTVYLDNIQATGGVRVSGGRIGGQLDLSRAAIVSAEGPALAATRLQVAQAVVLDDAELASAGTDATADFRSARISGDLELRRTRLRNTGGGAALRLSQGTVDGVLWMPGLGLSTGDIDLTGATVGGLSDEPDSLPDGVRLHLDGLTYRGLPGPAGRPPPVGSRLAWLRRMASYAAQPYRQLAAAYQAAGHEDEARRVLIAQQEHLLDSGLLGGWARVRRRLLGLTLGYGYRPWRAVVGLVGTLLLASVLLAAVDSATARPAAAGGGPCAVVEQVDLAIDLVVPLLDTGARDRCALVTTSPAGQAVAVAIRLLQLSGWAFATLVVAGYTGLVRRS